MSSSGTAVDDDDVGGTVKHVRTYQVYRGMSPEAVSRLEVCIRLSATRLKSTHAVLFSFQIRLGKMISDQDASKLFTSKLLGHLGVA